MEVLTGAVAIVELLTMAADTAAIIYKWAVKIYRHYHEDSSGVTTGRQPPPSVLCSVYGIISKRRSLLASQLLRREKSGA
jgi:hypothetical protein